MRILKKPENIIFDTENPNVMEFVSAPQADKLIPLHNVSVKSEYAFLDENFKPIDRIKHPVLKDYNFSYYYQIQI